MKKALLFCFLLILCSCQASTTPEPTKMPTPTQTLPASSTPQPISTQTPQPAVTTVIPTATQVPFMVCCPLEDETIESLSGINVNPLVIPPIGKDEGHHGVDFAYFRRGERISIQGIEIYAMLSGKTVLTLSDNIPYGNTILIETPLADLPENTREALLAAYLPIPETVVYQGECPDFESPALNGDMSAYHLYAHMETRPEFQPGDPISCGTKLGTVGNTGYSSNPHLHLETRLGPSGADFTTMAFYSPAYSTEQRANYCLWRMSGYYQLFDPFLILNAENGALTD